MEIDPPTETFGMGGINNSVSICTPLAIFKEGVVGRRKKRLRVAWGVRAVGSDSLMFFAGERVLSDWLWDELAVTWRRGSKCTNDCEQSGHSNHEYWICKGAHLQRATPPPPSSCFLLGRCCCSLNWAYLQNTRGDMLSWGRCEEVATVWRNILGSEYWNFDESRVTSPPTIRSDNNVVFCFFFPTD